MESVCTFIRNAGLSADINEKEAAKYPIRTKSNWTVRKGYGAIIRP